MPTAAFYLEIILASISVASSLLPFDSIPRCLSCPCGSGSKSYTHCIDVSILNDFTCERWSQCQTCRANVTTCITCPPDRFGPICSEKGHTRRDIQNDPDSPNILRYPRQSASCPYLEQPESGSIRCSQTGNERSCSSRCLPGYHFEDEETVNEMTLRCRGNVWTPRRFFPPCKSGGQCEVEMTGAGFYNCTIDMEGTHCDITCNGQQKGMFHCYPGRPWNPPLPVCAVPKEVEKKGSTCEDPGIPYDGIRLNPDGSNDLNTRMFQEGETVIFTCIDGLGLRGNSIITCSAGGTWSAPLPQCITFRPDPPTEVTQLCPLLEMNPNVEVEELFAEEHQKNRGFDPGEELNFRCREGYDLVGPNAIECLRNGRWSSPPPTCNPRSPTSNPPTDVTQLCPFLTMNSNVEVEELPVVDHHKNRGFRPGAELKFRCREGYDLVGPNAIECLRNGRWSGSPPACIFRLPASNPDSQIRCQNPGHIPNGQVDVFPPFDDPNQPSADEDDFDFPLGTHLKFRCANGFRLIGKDFMNCESNGYWSGYKPLCATSR